MVFLGDLWVISKCFLSVLSECALSVLEHDGSLSTFANSISAHIDQRSPRKTTGWDYLTNRNHSIPGISSDETSCLCSTEWYHKPIRPQQQVEKFPEGVYQISNSCWWLNITGSKWRWQKSRQRTCTWSLTGQWGDTQRLTECFTCHIVPGYTLKKTNWLLNSWKSIQFNVKPPIRADSRRLSSLAETSDTLFRELSRQSNIVVGNYKYLQCTGEEDLSAIFGHRKWNKYDGIHYASTGSTLFQKDVCALLSS